MVHSVWILAPIFFGVKILPLQTSPRFRVSEMARHNASLSGTISRRRVLPMASLGAYPVIASKDGLTYIIVPSESLIAMLSPVCSMAVNNRSCSSSFRLCSSAFENISPTILSKCTISLLLSPLFLTEANPKQPSRDPAYKIGTPIRPLILADFRISFSKTSSRRISETSGMLTYSDWARFSMAQGSFSTGYLLRCSADPPVISECHR